MTARLLDLFEPCGLCQWCRGDAAEPSMPGSCQTRFGRVLAIAQTEDVDGPWVPPDLASKSGRALRQVAAEGGPGW